MLNTHMIIYIYIFLYKNMFIKYTQCIDCQNVEKIELAKLLTVN